MKAVDKLVITSVAQAITSVAGGFLVATQGRGTGLLVISNDVPYGFTFPDGDEEDLKDYISMLFLMFQGCDEPFNEELQRFKAKLVPMSMETQETLNLLIGLYPMMPLVFVPKDDLGFALQAKDKVVH
jgi:hypothetical protein